jgi:hypothetical protein
MQATMKPKTTDNPTPKDEPVKPFPVMWADRIGIRLFVISSTDPSKQRTLAIYR